MGVFLRILIAGAALVAGSLAITHNYQLTQLFGYNDYAERFLGQGGTYSMWKLLGVATIIAGLWYAFH